MSQDKLKHCYEICKQKISFKPEVAIVLGSGLGDYAESLKIVETLEYSDIDGFPISTVSGHKGRFIFGYEGDVAVVAMQGRVHFYEGYPMEEVVLPIRLMLLSSVTVEAIPLSRMPLASVSVPVPRAADEDGTRVPRPVEPPALSVVPPE